MTMHEKKKSFLSTILHHSHQHTPPSPPTQPPPTSQPTSTHPQTNLYRPSKPPLPHTPSQPLHLPHNQPVTCPTTNLYLQSQPPLPTIQANTHQANIYFNLHPNHTDTPLPHLKPTTTYPPLTPYLSTKSTSTQPPQVTSTYPPSQP